jgi:hypothetical protein
MVLQTFATHYTAILGAVKVPAFHKHAMEPHCALSLAAAAVSSFISLFTAVPGIMTFFFTELRLSEHIRSGKMARLQLTLFIKLLAETSRRPSRRRLIR